MGTGLAPAIVDRLTRSIAGQGVRFALDTEVRGLRRERDGSLEVATSRGPLRAPFGLAAPGREGAHWFRGVARSLGVEIGRGAIDVGCRVEVASPVYDEITRVLYDPRFRFVTPTHGDATRTFCTNPGGALCLEGAGGLCLVNGHAFKQRKTANTNFAILNTVTMTEPVQDNTEMGRKVMEFANFWAGGQGVIAQRWGDLMEGRRSRAATFHSRDRGYDKMCPTLPPGEGVTPGDGAGKSRGIVGAALTGMLAAEGILSGSGRA